MLDEGGNCCFKSGDAAVNAAPDLAIGQQSEEPLDLVEPGTAGRGEVHMPARSPGKPVADQRRLMGGVVIHHDMHGEVGRNGGFDLVQEFAELGGTVARIALADHPAGGDVANSDVVPCRV